MPAIPLLSNTAALLNDVASFRDSTFRRKVIIYTTIPPRAVVFNVTRESEADMALQISRYPIDSGAVVGEHVTIQPTVFRLRCYVSNNFVGFTSDVGRILGQLDSLLGFSNQLSNVTEPLRSVTSLARLGDYINYCVETFKRWQERPSCLQIIGSQLNFRGFSREGSVFLLQRARPVHNKETGGQGYNVELEIAEVQRTVVIPTSFPVRVARRFLSI